MSHRPRGSGARRPWVWRRWQGAPARPRLGALPAGARAAPGAALLSPAGRGAAPCPVVLELFSCGSFPKGLDHRPRSLTPLVPDACTAWRSRCRRPGTEPGHQHCGRGLDSDIRPLAEGLSPGLLAPRCPLSRAPSPPHPHCSLGTSWDCPAGFGWHSLEPRAAVQGSTLG